MLVSNFWRKFIYFLVTIVVLAIAVYVVLFALGVRIDWQNLKFKHTGIIFLKTDPSQVTVQIDGKEVATQTPLKKRWVLPGQYKVRVSKDGYYPWESIVEVESGVAAEEKNIKLFLKDPVKEKITTAKNIYFNSQRQIGYTFGNKLIDFFSLSPEKNKRIAKLDKPIEKVDLNTDQTWALINRTKIINLLDGSMVLDLSKRYPKYEFVAFHPDRIHQLILKKKNTYYLLDQDFHKISELVKKEKNTKYHITSSGIYYLDRDKKTATLKKINWLKETKKVASDQIEITNDQQVDEQKDESKLNLFNLTLTTKDNYLILKDKKDRYYLMADDKLNYLTKDLADLNIITSQCYLVTNSNGEYWQVDYTKEEKDERRLLITRLSAPLYKPGQIAEGYYSYLLDGTIYIVSLEGTDGYAVSNNLRIEKYWAYSSSVLFAKDSEDNLVKFEIN